MKGNNSKYLKRAIQLATLGAGKVAPNPMVGAVLVHEDRIIGEGWHQEYGGPHAEVNAIGAVKPKDAFKVDKSHFFISLEPCCVFGKTPPCTDLILRMNIPEISVSNIDLSENVAGKGLHILEENGKRVNLGALEALGNEVSTIRNTFVKQGRPYIVLKFAQSKNGVMGYPHQRVKISNPYSQRLVHRWRSEFSAILVGTNTAVVDNPKLDNRYYFGPSPTRVLLDFGNRVPEGFHLKKDDIPTLIFTSNLKKRKQAGNFAEYIPLDFGSPAEMLEKLLKQLAARNLSSLLVEGGATTIQHFLDSGLWDEARVITSSEFLSPTDAILAPVFDRNPEKTGFLAGNTVEIFYNR